MMMMAKLLARHCSLKHMPIILLFYFYAFYYRLNKSKGTNFRTGRTLKYTSLHTFPLSCGLSCLAVQLGSNGYRTQPNILQAYVLLNRLRHSEQRTGLCIIYTVYLAQSAFSTQLSYFSHGEPLPTVPPEFCSWIPMCSRLGTYLHSEMLSSLLLC